MKCYLHKTNKCKGQTVRRFSGGDEGVLCTKHWKEAVHEVKEMKK